MTSFPFSQNGISAVPVRSRFGGGCNGHLIPKPFVQKPPARLRNAASPLLEEERNAAGKADIPNGRHPFRLHGTKMRTAFSTDDYPVHSVESQLVDRSEQWFY